MYESTVIAFLAMSVFHPEIAVLGFDPTAALILAFAFPFPRFGDFGCAIVNRVGVFSAVVIAI